MSEVSTPYTVSEVAALTGFSARVVTLLFERELGMIVYEAPNLRRKRQLPDNPGPPAHLSAGHAAVHALTPAT
jgi:hypothetical protein